MRSCGGSAVMSSPKNRMRPAVGGKSPVMALNSVVLPAPLAAQHGVLLPGGHRQRHVVDRRSAPKARVTPSSTSASFDAAAGAAAGRAAAGRAGA
jgi:hypothetical protein